MFYKYKELIAIKKDHKIFHYSTIKDCSNYKVISEACNRNQIVVEVSRGIGVDDTWEKVIIIFTNNNVKGININYYLPDEYKVEFTSGDNNLIVGNIITGDIILGKYSLVIFSR